MTDDADPAASEAESPPATPQAAADVAPELRFVD